MLVLNQEENTKHFYNSFRDTADNWDNIERIIIDNGSNPPLTLHETLDTGIKMIRNEKNLGVPVGMDQVYRNSTADYLCIVHNDVTMHEKGWDTKIIQIIEEANKVQKVGVAGFFGAKGMGSNDLYRRPYHNTQLMRFTTVCSCTRVDKGHRHRQIRDGKLWERIAVLDGLALICSRAFLDDNDGFDCLMSIFHNYDQHTCLQAINLGYQNLVLRVEFDHISGMTNNLEKWEEGTGKTQMEIHYQSGYPYFYFYWHPDRVKSGENTISLPYSVK
jgi:glycosyltransferase involved in cell wall biosynthesis